jgi:hypothetical protein
MPLQSSNLTHEEFVLHNGYLSRERAEDVIELAHAAEDLDEIAAQLDEAKSGFPDEDFLQAPIDDLRDLLKHVRGDNRDTVQGLIDKLEEIQTSTHQSAEHGADELRKAIKTLNGETTE